MGLLNWSCTLHCLEGGKEGEEEEGGGGGRGRGEEEGGRESVCETERDHIKERIRLNSCELTRLLPSFLH